MKIFLLYLLSLPNFLALLSIFFNNSISIFFLVIFYGSSLLMALYCVSFKIRRNQILWKINIVLTSLLLLICIFTQIFSYFNNIISFIYFPIILISSLNLYALFSNIPNKLQSNEDVLN